MTEGKSLMDHNLNSQDLQALFWSLPNQGNLDKEKSRFPGP